MKRTLVLLSTLSLCASSAIPILAAEAPGGPPRVIQIFREEVKPGKAAAHEKIEVGWPAAFAKANRPAYYLAMTSVTGPSEAWFLTPWDSIAAMEKEQQAVDKDPALTAELQRLSHQDGELLSSVSSILITYREDLSYRPNFNPAEMRYFGVTTIRVNPGYEADLVAVRKIINEAHDKARMDEHWVTYQVTSGAPAGTYLIFLPMKSLAELDTAREIHGRPFQDALGEEGRTRLRELTRAAVRGSETAVFAFSPKMSYVSKEFASASLDYWMPKPEVKVPAAKKEAPKK